MSMDDIYSQMADSAEEHRKFMDGLNLDHQQVLNLVKYYFGDIWKAIVIGHTPVDEKLHGLLAILDSRLKDLLAMAVAGTVYRKRFALPRADWIGKVTFEDGYLESLLKNVRESAEIYKVIDRILDDYCAGKEIYVRSGSFDFKLNEKYGE